MRRFVYLALLPLVATLGVAGSGCLGEAGDELEGAWTLRNVNNRDCLMVMEFGVGEFEQSLYCTLSDNSVGLELSRGRYRVVGNTATFTPTHATCADIDRNGITTSFSIEDDTLTMDLPRGRFALSRGKQASPGAAAYGCFGDMFTFTESMLRLLD